MFFLYLRQSKIKMRTAAIPKIVPNVAPRTVNIFPLLLGATAAATASVGVELAVGVEVAVGVVADLIDEVSDCRITCCPLKSAVAFSHEFSCALKTTIGSV